MTVHSLAQVTGQCLLLRLQAFLYKTVPQVCSTGPAAASPIGQLAGYSPSINSFDDLLSIHKPYSYYSNTSFAAEPAGTCPAGQADGAASTTAAPSSSSSSSEAAWPIVWKLVCGQLTSSAATVSGTAGMTLCPAVFKPLLQAAQQCAAHPASSSSSSSIGLLGLLHAAVQRVRCRVSWTALLVATRLLRVLLFVAQVGH
jgi:hypothetical protein